MMGGGDHYFSFGRRLRCSVTEKKSSQYTCERLNKNFKYFCTNSFFFSDLADLIYFIMALNKSFQLREFLNALLCPHTYIYQKPDLRVPRACAHQSALLPNFKYSTLNSFHLFLYYRQNI